MRESPNIIVIPAEGDSAETEQWYIDSLSEYCQEHFGGCRIEVFSYNEDLDIDRGVRRQIYDFFSCHRMVMDYEIHAQGGLGAYTAYMMVKLFPQQIKRIFFVGGAPGNAMTGIARWFHRYFSGFWYHIRGIIPFFADDPNPLNNPTIAKIKASSTAVMQSNPKLYRNQLQFIAEWAPAVDWQIPQSCHGVFVPNGRTFRPKFWDNTYNNDLAGKIWQTYGITTSRAPDWYFSFYSMMPAEALFAVMEEVRNDEID